MLLSLTCPTAYDNRYLLMNNSTLYGDKSTNEC